MYRVMYADDDGLPHVGEEFANLGVRPGEIPVDEEGCVSPGTGGLSVFDDPKRLPANMRPRALGGLGERPLFALSGNLPAMLVLRRTRGYHYQIEPAQRCRLAEYQAALFATRTLWRLQA